MAVYVMSDLHGNYEGFMSILLFSTLNDASFFTLNGAISA